MATRANRERTVTYKTMMKLLELMEPPIGPAKFGLPEGTPHRSVPGFSRCSQCRQPRVCHSMNDVLACPNEVHVAGRLCKGQKWMIAKGFKK